MMTNIETEDLTGLVSPPGLPDLSQAEMARSLPLVVLSLGIGRSTPYLEEFLNNPINEDIVPTLRRFQTWVAESAVDGEDPWPQYLVVSRATLLESAWAAYDTDGDVDAEVRGLIGDELLGSSLWFCFLHSEALINDVDESRWTNLWTFLIIDDLLASDDEESTEEPAQTGRNSEW